jgi:hypothetical protein
LLLLLLLLHLLVVGMDELSAKEHAPQRPAASLAARHLFETRRFT